MREETIARNYASALFELAARENETESYGAGLDAVVALLDEVPGFREFLETPRIDAEQKKKVLRDSLEGRVPTHVLNFILLVVDKRRQRVLDRIATEYRDILDQSLGRSHVEVHVARPLGEGELSEIAAELSRILGKEAIPHVRVKPELVGGIVFRSGDTIFDGSVRRRLQRMRRQLMTTDVSTDQG
ncbi:F0F1 ATP synthase subunit delta [soil metagenome]